MIGKLKKKGKKKIELLHERIARSAHTVLAIMVQFRLLLAVKPFNLTKEILAFHFYTLYKTGVFKQQTLHKILYDLCKVY